MMLRVVQHQVTIDHRRNRVVRIELANLARLFADIDLDNLALDILFVQNDTRAMAVRIGSARVERHDVLACRVRVAISGYFLRCAMPGTAKGPLTDRALFGLPGTYGQCTSFQYSFFNR